jgi:lipopolysaccharide export system protein LptA
MSKQPFISNFFRLSLFFSVFFLFASEGLSEQGSGEIKGPIVITSQMLTADNKTNTAIFERSVVAKTTDITIYADKMIVRNEKDTGNVTRIDAEGNVKFIKGNRVIISREATYFADGEKVIFTGEPRATEGENVVTGRKMTYYMKEDRFLVEESKVFLTKKK